MKFVIAALIASSSAIRIGSLATADKHKGCISHEMAKEGFKDLDTNHNGSLSYEEIKVGIETIGEKTNHVITKKEWEWIEATGKKIDSKTPGKVDEKEFWEFANAIFDHFDLCKGLEHEERRERRHEHREHECVDHQLAREGFKALDTNHNGSLSYEEIKVGLETIAEKQNHVITKEEWEWIEATGKKIDSKTPGKVDEHEFWEFANAIFHHFDLCKIAREGDRAIRQQRREHREHECVDHELAREGFKALDTNHNGSLSYEEIKVGLETIAEKQNHVITKKEWEWIEATGKKIDSKTPGKVDEHEFWEFANAIFHHFGLCHIAREGDRAIRQEHREERREENHACDLDEKDAQEIFDKIDTNHNGKAAWKEVKASLMEVAKSKGKSWSQTDKQWIRNHFKDNQAKKGEGLDEKEFLHFANQVENHFDFCGAKK